MAKKSTKKSKKDDNWSTQQKVGIAVGLTATAVAAAGAYFLYGSEDAKQNRKKVKSWMLKAKAEVLESLEQAQDMTEEEYDKLIDSVSNAYSRLKDASKADIATFKREMKEHWSGIEEVAKPVKKRATKTAKKAVKKAKKVAKKATKKAAKKTKK
ncbi:MAG TPA: hypothetical protein VKP88_03845 [Candidatus Paceibacterota bacterium]|nr:hypothetical protein [Candidatus Paceibacterota bacterium]